MILLDTCALIYDALAPERLSTAARAALDTGETNGTLACADISLWEIAMLVDKGRLDPGTDCATFCRLALDARGVRVLPITPDIAAESVRLELPHGDPADRLIAATALIHGTSLVTVDGHLRNSATVETVW
ncbi:MAG: type II toxin-antitoxin system VapC family toxin [Pseudomonadota bacterium]|nr:type II toxin-antitoxin system VapC family toxin [Pseudomonadota bacterium]